MSDLTDVVKKPEKIELADLYSIDGTEPEMVALSELKNMTDEIIKVQLSDPEKVTSDKIRICTEALGLYERYQMATINKISITKFKYSRVRGL